MTVVLNDPTWWSAINAYSFASYFIVAACVVVAYDWALTFGQEVELIWRQRWSVMTVMYLGVRYLGILYVTVTTLASVPTISLTDTVNVSLFGMCATRGRSLAGFVRRDYLYRMELDWYCDICDAVGHHHHSVACYVSIQKDPDISHCHLPGCQHFNGVVTIMASMHTSGEELILSGTYQCQMKYAEHVIFLLSICWILATVWEVLTLSLAVWIAVKHFRELRQHSAGGIIGDCFTVLMKTHVVYFAR
ncbi:uncharacterized protein HD556DRAFT_377275 [Suillus plorans]|uniref:DUF6533 domain-containing protein n=1 Tax=Suillus plorans TaxID=116603 RepID=A0A9P7DI14_9AGAM|nr:uncharacterized protein HD556DRAFT_377275 [Suillus plorans]KAG1795303.1 hypothetical protein HD556DRAFT_377275 [Suillus plorans]